MDNAISDRRSRLICSARRRSWQWEFADGFRQVAAKARIESTQEIKDIRAARDTAYAWSRISVALFPKEGGEKWENSGHVLTVFHRSSSGHWLLARDTNLMAGAGMSATACTGPTSIA